MISSSFIFPRYGKKDVSKNEQTTVASSTVETETVKIIANSFEENQERYIIGAEIPNVSGMPDTIKQEQANAFIQQEVDKIISEFKEKIPAKLIDDSQSALEIGYETIYISESLVSIKLNISEYMIGDSNQTVYIKMINFDIDNSKEIVLESIFNKDSQYLFFLSTFTAQQLLNSYTEAGDDAVNFIKNITDSKKENFQNFGFNKDELIIYFQTDQIGSLAIGAEEVKITADQNMLGYLVDGPIKTLLTKN
jgi:RecG-like helicase